MGTVVGRAARTLLGLGGTAAMALALSSCTPEIKGITGLMRTENGLEGVWVACPGDGFQGALLIRDSNTTQSQHIGRWETSRPENRNTWLIQDPTTPDGWDVWKPAPSEFEPGHVYTLYAWSKENEINAAAVDFEASDVAGLAVGQVLVNDPASEDVDPMAVSMDEMTKRACRG